MAAIYSHALHTVIYLGEATFDTEMIVSDVRSGGGVDEAYTMVKYLEGGWESQVGDILCRPWFTRTWVYQEIIFSGDPWVQCGSSSVKWTDLCQHVLSSAVESIPGLEHLLGMARARSAYQDIPRTGKAASDFPTTLLNIMVARRGLVVSNASDMLFAHIGIAEALSTQRLGHTQRLGQTQRLIRVDYRKSWVAVYQDLARYYITTFEGYDLFSHIEDIDPSERHPELPSWVPNWASLARTCSTSPILAPVSHSSKVQGRSFYSYHSYLSGSSIFSCIGNMIATVGACSPPIDWDPEFLDPQINLVWLIRDSVLAKQGSDETQIVKIWHLLVGIFPKALEAMHTLLGDPLEMIYFVEWLGSGVSWTANIREFLRIKYTTKGFARAYGEYLYARGSRPFPCNHEASTERRGESDTS
jgi:hypothetical protein